MDRPRDSQTPPAKKEKPMSSLQNSYLTAYNSISSFLWTAVLTRVVLTLAEQPASIVYHSTNTLLTWTQTLALLEPLHSLVGVVRAPLLTTVMQVASRFLLVWGIMYPYPQLATDEKFRGSWAYCSMVIAWSVTEVVRYAFFAMSLQGGVPQILKWMRYNLFFVLYPLGISSECWLVYLAATGPAKYTQVGGLPISWGLYAVLAIYVPGELAENIRMDILRLTDF